MLVVEAISTLYLPELLKPGELETLNTNFQLSTPLSSLVISSQDTQYQKLTKTAAIETKPA